MPVERHHPAAVALLLLISVALAVSSFRQIAWYAKAGAHGNVERGDLASLNVFLDHSDARLQDQVPELERVLDFMVWPSVEQPLRARLLDLYRQQANQSPLNSQLWLKLLHQQSLSAGEQRHYGWVLRQVLATASWRHDLFVNLAYNCVSYRDVLSHETESACNRLLARAVGQQKLMELSRALGLELQQTERILQQAAQAK